MADNHLYYGDNLDILRHTTPVYIPAESVDLIYLDPPFNSNADYNVLFAEKDGKQAAAQIRAGSSCERCPMSSSMTRRVTRSGGMALRCCCSNAARRSQPLLPSLTVETVGVKLPLGDNGTGVQSNGFR